MKDSDKKYTELRDNDTKIHMSLTQWYEKFTDLKDSDTKIHRSEGQ